MYVQSTLGGAAVAGLVRENDRGPQLSVRRRIRLAGAIIAWYDCFLSGTVAVPVFNKIFFPGIVPIPGVIVLVRTRLIRARHDRMLNRISDYPAASGTY
ncbi:MAG: hypothetical protein EPN70_16435 [Paraburkholderia sp.]|uniref:hypothetical protein n=1 Tax=Paraburkholderia sp. TaxID=1926495 RepID=UPI0011FEB260|nr:hypothetical protein [Paraburkholderia sp.]TAM02625.1 MAG: hypothetical protein EPN70_16435 [Paraburkholderia sp.]